MRLRWREATSEDFDRFAPTSAQPITAQRLGPPECLPTHFILQYLDDTQPGGGLWIDVDEEGA